MQISKVLAAACLLALSGCGDRQCCGDQAETEERVAASVSDTPSTASPRKDAAFDESFHTITLPLLNVEAPPGPNREVYLANCTVCHTMRYVMTQPLFPEKKWNDEVTKMIKSYGAPITEPNARLIVQYLAAIKGKQP